MDLGRLRAMARKEAIQLRRDPRSLLLGFLLPALLLVIYGYAITWDVNNIPLAVLDEDGSAASRDLVDAFTASGYFTLVDRLDRPADADRALVRGTATVVLHIPVDFSTDLSSGRPAPVQALVDGSDANTASIALGYTQAIVQRYSTKLLLDTREVRPPVTAATRVWYNEELSSRNMIVPGLVAVIMMIIAAMLTSLTLAGEWDRGTMEQLVATPVTRVEVVVGKLIPYLVIGLIDVALAVILGVILFGVPFRGNVLLFGVLSVAFLTGALGLGIFISAVAKNQLVATQMAMPATYLPAFLLSGFMFAISVMPKPLQVLTYLVPARYFLVVTRGIFLKGVGIPVLYLQGLLMIAFAALGLSLAVHAFRKEIL